MMNDRPEERILLADGGGGTRTRSLIREVFLAHLSNPVLDRLDDSACFASPGAELAFTTDGYVVDPLFFPGGDIGRLAACGTVNDLAMQGAEPRYVSLAAILEEGFPRRDLETIVRSFSAALRESGACAAAGDTKVVEAGKGGGVYFATAGIGVRRPGVDVSVSNARPGDRVIVTGTVGDHGMAVLSRRRGLQFESEIVSDVAPLWDMVREMLDVAPGGIRCLRDPTRGGLAGALCDIAERSGAGIRAREADIPVRRDVRGACRLLGLDPLHVANEGKALVVCDAACAELVLRTVRGHSLGRNAAIVGEVAVEPRGMVALETMEGGERLVAMPSGEDLPRIC